MRYLLTCHTISEIDGEEGLEKTFHAFRHAGWPVQDIQTLKEKGEFEMTNYRHDWGLAIKSTVKLEVVE